VVTGEAALWLVVEDPGSPTVGMNSALTIA
jgi:hypothetical protein